jgi:hypothetical protein
MQQQEYNYHIALIVHMDARFSKSLAWKHWRPLQIDYAISINKSESLDQLGVVFILFTAARFAAIFGEQPRPRENPGEAPNGQPFELANWNVLRGLFTRQQMAIDKVRDMLINGVFPSLLEPLKVDRSLRTRSTLFIFSTIDNQMLNLKESDFAFIYSELAQTYKYPDDVSTFLAQKKERLRDLEEAGQPTPAIQAIKTIKAAFPMQLFQVCWTDYVKAHGAIADQTVDNLCDFIVVYAEQRLEHTVDKAVLAQVGNKVAAQSVAFNATASQEPDLLAALVALVAKDPASAGAFLRKQVPPVTATGTAAAIAAAPAPVAPKPKKKKKQQQQQRPKKYCWTHGSQHSHSSEDCFYPAAGHQETATAVNVMGGQPVT